IKAGGWTPTACCGKRLAGPVPTRCQRRPWSPLADRGTAPSRPHRILAGGSTLVADASYAPRRRATVVAPGLFRSENDLLAPPLDLPVVQESSERVGGAGGECQVGGASPVRQVTQVLGSQLPRRPAQFDSELPVRCSDHAVQRSRGADPLPREG